MDPDRVRAYLQVACAGLGFDIGEVWWTSNENGSSTVAAIEESNDNEHHGDKKKKFRFVQLYTSKSYESRRSELVNPPDPATEVSNHGTPLRRSGSTENLQKHVLSPQLVDAISNTTQVVWANTMKQEGLTGRSDIRLQTAVGMPVAVDERGNMCIVVMFSPRNIQSSDEAMEYLQSITESATSTSIPCLLPVFDPNNSQSRLVHIPHHDPAEQLLIPHPDASALGEGVTARFVSLEDIHPMASGSLTNSDEPELHGNHDLSAAPKDTFGIPMLPSFAELGNNCISSLSNNNNTGNNNNMITAVNGGGADSDAFDEASYGVWSTIMQTVAKVPQPQQQNSNAVVGPIFGGGGSPQKQQHQQQQVPEFPLDIPEEEGSEAVQADPSLQVILPNQRCISESRKERLAEFINAFLGMSVFDLADVWVPAASNGFPDCLRHVMSVSSTDTNENLNEFKFCSENALIKFWTGAVGRAYSSGNPVWSASPGVFVDAARAFAFDLANVQTVLAVPVYTGKQVLPSCVVACYSLVRSCSVPFVLRFVQQALRLLWDGLDQAELHESIGESIWQGVAPADLGEMAADVEMQHHFVSRKRTHSFMLDVTTTNDAAATDTTAQQQQQQQTPKAQGSAEDVQASLLSAQLQSITLPSGEVINVPLQLPEDPSSTEKEEVPITSGEVPPVPVNLNTVQNHLTNAFKSISEAVPFDDRVATNREGTKRAHVDMGPISAAGNSVKPLPMMGPINTAGNAVKPLQKPLGFPTKVLSSTASMSSSSSSLASKANARPSPPPHHQVQPQPHSSPVQPQQQQQTQPQQQVPMRYEPVTQSIAQQPVQNNFLAQPSQYAVQKDPSKVPPQPMNGVYCQPTTVVSVALQQQQQQQQQPVSGAAQGKVCRIQGCDSPAVPRRPYCETHSGNRLCEHSGCTKCAQGCTRYCIAHGGGRRCTFPGCDKGARDKFFCAAHGGGKRCKQDGCTKSAVGGSNLCTAHGGGRRCAIDGCDKSAQSSTKFCVKHGGGKKCSHEGCEKVARGRTNFCAAHGGGVRCKLEGCNRVAIGKMQLCRAHGGASSRSAKGKKPDTHVMHHLMQPPPVVATHGPPIMAPPPGSMSASGQPDAFRQAMLQGTSVAVDRMTSV